MLNLKIKLSLVEDFYLYYFLSVSSLLSINAVELRDALTTNSNVTRGKGKKTNKQESPGIFYPLFHVFIIQVWPLIFWKSLLVNESVTWAEEIYSNLQSR